MRSMKRLVVTGGCGFIGSNFVRLVLSELPGARVTVLDKLTYAGNLENLADVKDHPQFALVKGDITDRAAVEAVLSEPTDAVVNFAAETHVDRAVMDSSAFVLNNVCGVQVLLDACRKHQVGRFLQVSTDEVYGSLGPTGQFTETTCLAPRNPYSATKAAADLLCRACFITHGMDTVVTRSCNNYGPYQFPEKVVPLFITNALADVPVPLYGDGLYVREWIHVADNCRAILEVLLRGRPGEVYNIAAGQEITNLELTRKILSFLGKPESLIRHVKDRPGHDRRYSIDTRKVRTELGWSPRHPFDEGLRLTVQWYLDHRTWWEHIRSGEYQEYYRRQYGDR